MTRLFLIRHGRSVWNADHRIQGQADPPLDGVGREQASRLAERLREDAPITLYTSPLQRAQETAEIVGEALDVPVVPDERLREYDVGAITGLTWAQVEEQYPEVARHWAEAAGGSVIPGEEGDVPFRERVVAGFGEIVSRHAEETVGVVAHGGTLGAYLNHLIGRPARLSPFRFANGSLSIVELHPVRPRIALLNDTCHLGGKV
ncbi:MAG: histidine phosphatase family protein [Chloroflexota bacterium]|nr:histidine phosphatase family protein [Chloroflexota bacterium]